MWKWDKRIHNYRDDQTGRILSRERALEFVDQSLLESTNVAGDLADLWDAGQLSVADFNTLVRAELKYEYIRQGTLGRGGRPQMTAADWGSIGGSLADQYRYLTPFMAEIAAGALTVGQVKARLAMYVNSAREAFFRGLARAFGIPNGRLPAQPGDGSTECLTNCKCSWTIEEIYDDAGVLIRWDCYWKYGETEDHCDTCRQRETTWSPFVINK